MRQTSISAFQKAQAESRIRRRRSSPIPARCLWLVVIAAAQRIAMARSAEFENFALCLSILIEYLSLGNINIANTYVQYISIWYHYHIINFFPIFINVHIMNMISLGNLILQWQGHFSQWSLEGWTTKTRFPGWEPSVSIEIHIVANVCKCVLYRTY